MIETRDGIERKTDEPLLTSLADMILTFGII